MVGQHIYSRCLEGYFSKSRLNADSTTVTISANMFAREEQARKIAKECEKISTLEDVRAVSLRDTGRIQRSTENPAAESPADSCVPLLPAAFGSESDRRW